MAEHNTPEGKFRRLFGGVALGGAVTAFFISPLMPFANPVALAVTGAIAGVGLLGVYNVRVVPGVKPFADRVGWLCLLLGGGGVITALVFAGEASMSLDSYCARVQARMIAAEQRGHSIGDTKDVLQTLRCRPQAIPETAGGAGASTPGSLPIAGHQPALPAPQASSSPAPLATRSSELVEGKPRP